MPAGAEGLLALLRLGGSGFSSSETGGILCIQASGGAARRNKFSHREDRKEAGGTEDLLLEIADHTRGRCTFLHKIPLRTPKILSSLTIIVSI